MFLNRETEMAFLSALLERKHLTWLSLSYSMVAAVGRDRALA